MTLYVYDELNREYVEKTSDIEAMMKSIKEESGGIYPTQALRESQSVEEQLLEEIRLMQLEKDRCFDV